MDSIQQDVWENSKRGEGACTDCLKAGGAHNHPGFFDPAADILVVEETPSDSHFGYDSYDRTQSFEWYKQFYEVEHLDDVLSWPPVSVFLEPLFGPEPIGIEPRDIPDEVFMTSCVKCHASGNERDDAYESCKSYLDREISEMDPEVVITAGGPASKWTAQLLGISPSRTREISISRPRWWGMSPFETDPQMIHVPHWGYYNTHHQLTDDQWEACIDAVRDGLLSTVYDGS